jgi:diacylglycerol kinase (ATP)
VVIVFNPVAGRRRASLLWRVLDVLVANGVRLDLAETHRAGHAEALAREAVSAGEKMVVAAGGDGTIAEVANGLVGSPAQLGIIPLGTANVLAHELALPFAPQAVAAALAFGRTRLLWPGVAQAPDFKRLFVQMLGVGFDAYVVHTLPTQLKRLFGRGAYVLQSTQAMFRYNYAPVRVRLDGVETSAASVIVSKGVLYGGKYRLAPDAEPAEPGFSVVLFDRSGPAATLLYGAALPINLLGQAPGVRHVRAQQIEFIGNIRLPAQSDGDPVGCVPLSITDAAAPIHVVTG